MPPAVDAGPGQAVPRACASAAAIASRPTAWRRAGAPSPTPTQSSDCRSWASRGSRSAAWCRCGRCRSSTAWRRSTRSASAASPCTCSASPGPITSASSAAYGVTSFDSTSPFRQAFKDDKDNYYVDDDVKLVALRVPPSDGNARLQARIQAGQLDQREVRAAEREALRALRAYDAGKAPYGPALEALERTSGCTTRCVLAGAPSATARCLSSRPGSGVRAPSASAGASRWRSSAAPSATSAAASTTSGSSTRPCKHNSPASTAGPNRQGRDRESAA